ncbi:hypothetical protein HAPgp19 [Halomonas phage phiHAP-1]|uniref:Uncharacterized protein n=1 Tax=Halomonas phage phiHAP-1 (isolate -/Gulf of Mexico/-/2001) TaxID=1283337 RepID=B0ZSG7_BPHA1|nr:hypothetical protein HAPgp19 [Halomonas phage phiHAP-1]ABY90387.1 hypothetical protein HAPgp19 [Halomonas phage phiHAP-1]
MNRTHLEHALIALLIQFALYPFIGLWAAGAIAVTLFLGREIAQNEYRLANQRGWHWGQVPPVRWHEGFWRGWTRDSVLDVLSPLLACWLIAWLSRYCPLLS